FIEEKWPEALGPKDEQRKHELVINDWLPADLHSGRNENGIFEYAYPATTSQMPQLPEPPGAIVALRYPLPLSSVFIDGPVFKAVRVWVLFQATDHLQDDAWHELEPGIEGGREFWIPDGFLDRAVSAIRFSLDIGGEKRNLQLLIVPADARPRRQAN